MRLTECLKLQLKQAKSDYKKFERLWNEDGDTMYKTFRDESAGKISAIENILKMI